MKKNIHLIILTAALILTFTTLLISAASTTDSDNIILTVENTVVKLSETSYQYDGKEKKPNVTVKYIASDGTKTTLTEKKDYSVTYKDNREVGAAKVVISGKGDYTGKVVVKYGILPKKVTALKVTSTSKTGISISWNEVSGAKGYDVVLYKVLSKTAKHYTVLAGKAKFHFSDLPVDRDYRIKVRAYISLNGKRAYGPYSDTVKTATNAVVGKSTLRGWCSLLSIPTLEWTKVSKAEKYAVLRSTEKKGTYKRIATVSGNNYSDEGASIHKTYFYKIKAIRTVDGKKYNGRESNAVKLKAKRTVFVGDSIMSGLEAYKVFPGGITVTKVGMGTYTFYSSYYFTVNGSAATGCEKVISYNPDRVFIMLGMNESAYKKNGPMIEYYRYALEDILDARPGCEIILLPVSPTTANSAKTVPKKARIDSFNSALKAFAKEMGVSYYDYTAPYKDSNGYLTSKYNGGDGCHWNIAGYRLFLDKMNEYIKTKP